MHKNSKKTALRLLLTTTALAVCGYTHAAIVDRPVFKISGVVIVWGGDGSGSASVGDFIFNSGGSPLDLISANVQPVITGTLTSALTSTTANVSVSGQTLNDQGVIGVLDAGDSYSAFSPNETISTSVGKFESSFYIASNTAFTIRAQATLDVVESSSNASLGDVYRTLQIQKSGTDGGLNYGASSRFPHSGDSSTSGVLNNGFLNALTAEKLVFQGDRSTAVAGGTIADQSVRFTNTYEIASGGFELEANNLVANVVYTVAIP